MKAALIGYYGYRNTGDDALAAAAARGIRRLLHPGRLYLYSPRPLNLLGAEAQPLLTRLPPVRGLQRLNYYLSRGRASGSNLVVFGGGSIFHSHSDRHHEWFLDQAAPGPHAAIGVSIGPFDNAAGEKRCARILSKLKFIGVRDRLSLERLSAMKLAGVRMELTFDLAPQLLELLPQGPAHPPGETLGLAVAGWLFKREEERMDFVKKIREGLEPLFKKGVFRETALFTFSDERRSADRSLNGLLAEVLKGFGKVRSVPYSPNPLDHLVEAGKMKVMASMRLHGAIYGYLMRTPVVQLCCHEKNRSWADRVGMDRELNLKASDFAPRDLTGALEKAVRKDKAPSLDPAEALGLSQKNWDWIQKASHEI